MDPVAVEACGALAGEIFIGGHGVVHGDGREVEEERFVLGLGFEPGRCLVGEHLHDALVLATRRIQFEDAWAVLAVFGIFGSVGGLVVIAIGGWTGDFHASGYLASTESVHETVFDEDARKVTMVTGDREVIIKADIERTWRKFGGVIGAPFWRFVFRAIAQVPFTDRSGIVTMLLQ